MFKHDFIRLYICNNNCQISSIVLSNSSSKLLNKYFILFMIYNENMQLIIMFNIIFIDTICWSTYYISTY